MGGRIHSPPELHFYPSLLTSSPSSPPLPSLVAYEVPEWKSKAMGKVVTYGIKDSRSIKDQRENLPIFKLKDQLVAAVNDNQVCESPKGWTWEMV